MFTWHELLMTQFVKLATEKGETMLRLKDTQSITVHECPMFIVREEQWEGLRAAMKSQELIEVSSTPMKFAYNKPYVLCRIFDAQQVTPETAMGKKTYYNQLSRLYDPLAGQEADYITILVEYQGSWIELDLFADC